MKHEEENYNGVYNVKLVMNYNNGRLGVAREVSDIPDGVVGNDDNIYVFCKKCGCYMNYQKLGNGLMDAIWVCPKCTKRVREETAYNKMNQQNNSWLADNDFDTEDYDDLY